MGVSSIITVGLSAIRYKVVALELGAVGVGLIGLFVTALALATVLFGMGLSGSGVRYVAATDPDGRERDAYSVALVQGSFVLGIVGALTVVLLGPWIGQATGQALGSVWLVAGFALAVFASVVSAGQVALLNGVGRIRDIAVVNAGGALAGTLLMVGALQVSDALAIAAAIIAPPVATFVLSGWLARRFLPTNRPSVLQLLPVLRVMIALGLAFSASVLLSNFSQFLARVLINRELGIESVGYFQASWTVASVYLGFVLNSMAAEYYPRISRISTDTAELNTQVDRQIQIALLLAGPAIVATMLLAPFMLGLLYAPEFLVATDVLRWQLLGDILKVPAWALGFLLMARVARRRFFVSELSWNVVFLGGLLLLLPVLGVVGVGIAYLGAYAFYLGLLLWFARSESRFRLSLPNASLLMAFFATGAATMYFTLTRQDVGAFLAAGTAVLVSTVGLVIMRAGGRRYRSAGGS